VRPVAGLVYISNLQGEVMDVQYNSNAKSKLLFVSFRDELYANGPFVCAHANEQFCTFWDNRLDLARHPFTFSVDKKYTIIEQRHSRLSL
jgi:hypothetical protein